MNMLKFMLVLVLIILGLINRHHVKPQRQPVAKTSATHAAVDKEILNNAERLTETLRRCQQTAQNNRETK